MMQAIILGAGRGTRRLNSTQSLPASLLAIKKSESLLDWILHALNTHCVDDIIYVGGYHIEKVVERFTNLKFRFHANWKNEGELAALAQCKSNIHRDCLVICSDIIILPEAIQRLKASSANIGIGTYHNGAKDAFCGMILVRKQALKQVFDVVQQEVNHNPLARLNELIDKLRDQKRVALSNSAAPRQDRQALMRLIFRGKGKTLEQLSRLATNAVVLDQIRFSIADWEIHSADILNKINTTFPYGHLVIRSSTSAEDSEHDSQAGRFHSVLDINALDRNAIIDGVARVINSFTRHNRNKDLYDEIIVQQQIVNLAVSGVLLTRVADSGAPYFVVNIDRDTGRPNVVTSGASGNIETYFICWNAEQSQLSNDNKTVFHLGQELVELTHNDNLDIEFGIDKSGVCYLFQVRPLVEKAGWLELPAKDMLDFVTTSRNFVQERMGRHATLLGDNPIFGNMPDWNPAEMLGVSPKPLALSLYQRLIGNYAWSRARAMIAYRDVEPTPLIVAIGGRPYVDVRASLNAFLPKNLSDDIGELWINYCLQQLREQPHLHDKIEFELTVTCLDFNWANRVEQMRQAGLSSTQISTFREHLRVLTSNAVTGKHMSIQEALALIDTLETRRRKLEVNHSDSATKQALQIKLLLDDCVRFGVIPFAILARYAFITMSLLKSLVSQTILKPQAYDDILASIPTIASELSGDLSKLSKHSLSHDELIRKYGHLRPNSYEITSPNYETASEWYFASAAKRKPQSCNNKYSSYENNGHSKARDIFENHKHAINRLLDDLGLEFNHLQMLSFILESITARELAKFAFMKNLNLALEGMASFGKHYGLDRNDLSHLHIDEILHYATDSSNTASATRLTRHAHYRRKKMQLTDAIKLPDLIVSANDLTNFKMGQWRPNFITGKSVVAASICLDDIETELQLNNLAENIVLISAADPGYDWIFAHPIAGLVTQYGGIASHMAIRAAEFGIPAAIGCGSAIYKQLKEATAVELDCGNQRLSVAL